MKRNGTPMDYFGYQSEKQKAGKPHAKPASVGGSSKEGIQVVEMDHASTTIVRRISESLRKRWAGEK